MTLPTHLEPEMQAYLRGDLDGDVERRVQFFADVLVAGEVPYALEGTIRPLIADGLLSERGDILRDPDDYEYEHVYTRSD